MKTSTYLSVDDFDRLCQLVWSCGNQCPPVEVRKAFAETYYVSLSTVTNRCNGIVDCSTLDKKTKKWRIVGSSRCTLGQKMTKTPIADMKAEIRIEKVTGNVPDLEEFSKSHQITIDTVRRIYAELK